MDILNLLASAVLNTNDTGIIKISADDLVSNGLNMFYFIVGVVAVISIIFGGIKYTTSAGNAESVKKAKNTILFAVAGLVVVMLAFTITRFVIGRF